jgi:SAM-dependent methyltransferase
VGRGACLRPASEIVGARSHVLGLGLAPGMVELAADELRRDGVANTAVRVGDAEHLELAHESFDFVTCEFGVFNFRAPTAALAECRRVLLVGGGFAASTFVDGLHDYPWLLEVLGEFGPLAELRSRSGQTGPVLRSERLAVVTAAASSPLRPRRDEVPYCRSTVAGTSRSFRRQ